MKFVLIVGLAVVLAVVAEDPFKCVPKALYKENECNVCVCGEDFELGCGRLQCDNPRTRELRNCKESVTNAYQKDCNRCWCVDSIGTVCEDKKC